MFYFEATRGETMKKTKIKPSNIIDEIISAYNGVSNIQKRFKYSEPMGVYNWRSRGIPLRCIADIHLDTGISIKRLKTATSKKLQAVNHSPEAH